MNFDSMSVLIIEKTHLHNQTSRLILKAMVFGLKIPNHELKNDIIQDFQTLKCKNRGNYKTRFYLVLKARICINYLYYIY